MKSTFILITFCSLLLLFATGCEKDCINAKGINGEWIWTKSFGGIFGGTITPKDAGYNEKLIIDDFIIQKFINDSLVAESQYELEIRLDSFLGQRNFIVFPSGYEELIGISESELTFYEIMWDDGFKRYYSRQ
jgi:hypothetical protein